MAGKRSRSLFTQRSTTRRRYGVRRKRPIYAGRGGTKRRAYATPYGPRRAPAYRRRRYGVMKRQKTLKAKVDELARAVRAEQGTHLHKLRETGTYPVSAGGVDYYSNPFYTAQIKTALANLRYFDPSNPATLITGVDNTSGTYTRNCRIEWVTRKIEFKNSYQVPVKITVYNCFVKADTSSNIVTLINTSATDQVLNGDQTSNLIKPFEMTQMRALWRSKGHKSRILQPGQSFTFGTRIPGFDYKPALEDQQGDNYQVRYGAHTWLIRLEGVLSHDTTLGEYNTGEGSVDYDQRDCLMISYDAGTNLHDIYINDNADPGFTNNPVTGVRPISDNQSFSTA